MEAGIQSKIRDKLTELALGATWEYSNAELAKHIMVACQQVCAETLDVRFGFSSEGTSREQQTLSNFYTDPTVIHRLKETTMGSGMTRYFTTASDNISKTAKMVQQLEFGSDPDFDADMSRLLKAINLPQELVDMKIELCNVVFMNPENDKITARPDGTCLIDSIVSPVELLTSQKAAEMVRLSSKDIARGDTASSYQDVISSIKSTAGDITQKKKDRSRTKSKRLNMKRGGKAELGVINDRGSDDDYDPTKRGSKVAKKVPSLRLLSIPTAKEKKDATSKKKSIKQRVRRYVEHIRFVKGMSNIDGGAPKHLHEKYTQLYAQMYAMRVSKGLLMYWADEVVYYDLLEMPKNWVAKFSTISRNFDSWFARQ